MCNTKLKFLVAPKDLVTSKVKPGDNFFFPFLLLPGVKNMFGLHLEIIPGVNSGNAKAAIFTEIELSPGIKTILAVA